jgi:hypothetical protein
MSRGAWGRPRRVQPKALLRHLQRHHHRHRRHQRPPVSARSIAARLAGRPAVRRRSNRMSYGRLRRRQLRHRHRPELRRRNSGRCSHRSRPQDNNHRNARNIASALGPAARPVVLRRSNRTSCGQLRRRCHHRLGPRHRSSARCNHHRSRHRDLRRSNSSARCSRRLGHRHSNSACNLRRARHRSNSACSRRRDRHLRVRVGPDSLRLARLQRGRHHSLAKSRTRKSSGLSNVKMKRAATWPPVCISSPAADQCINTFRNCHGSRLSMSSGNSPGRPVRGVQSVYVPMTGPR